jgi:Fic family protein
VPEGDQLFDRSVFEAALPAVSSARLQTFLYAEYPNERNFVSKLEGQKTQQTPESLAELWGMDRASAAAKAAQLVELGVFEERGIREQPTYWVPFHDQKST